MPRAFEAGCTLEYWRSVSDFPVSEGWALKLFLAGPSAPDAIDSVSDEDRHKFRIEADDTAGFLPGSYSWSERAYFADDVFTVARGNVIVFPDISSAETGSFVSWVDAALELIEARIAGRITEGQDAESIQILGRSVSLIPMKELLALRRELKREQAAQYAIGGGGPQPVLFRFSRSIQP